MSRRASDKYDVAIVGAGPAGSVTALAFAQRGARVLLLEANPNACERLAGEWIHPPAVEILRQLGVEPRARAPFQGGRGFVVFPDDGSRAVVLPYDSGSFGFSFEHSELVQTLRAACARAPLVDYLPYARAVELGDRAITYQTRAGATHTVGAGLIVGAGGRTSIAHTTLGIERSAATHSRMAGLLLRDTELPFEGYGHVFLGGLGPILAYRVSAEHVRLLLDVPLWLRSRRGVGVMLDEAYAPAIPEPLRAAFRRALQGGSLSWATNQIRPRTELGREGLVLVGDAVGHHHPLTAVGMTLAFQDAVALANARSFESYRRQRILASRVPELLAVALYEVFADTSDEAVALRRAIFELWRSDPDERIRTMRYLGCQSTSRVLFGSSFYKALFRAGKGLVRQGFGSGQWPHVRDVSSALAQRGQWLLARTLHLQPATPTAAASDAPEGHPSAPPHASGTVTELAPRSRASAGSSRTGVSRALERAARALVAQQASDGSWEGEVVWSAMLAAQFVLASHLMNRPISAVRRQRFLLHFRQTRLASGTWGLSEWSEPSLFVTTLVYVAARTLGVPARDPLLAPGLAFIRGEGGPAWIPSWGKFWLALLNLYDWQGVSPVSPELWALPRALPLHPSRYYCHTRLIYLGMATLYGDRFTAPRTDLVDELRRELYPNGYEAVDFSRARAQLRKGDLYAPHGRALRASYRALGVIDRITSRKKRKSSLLALRERIRYELRTTHHTSISPVSGLLNILALYAADPRDPDAQVAYDHMDGWIWEDDVGGARLAGARSSTWDTSLAMQALAEAAPHVNVARALERAEAFLATQQIRAEFPDAAKFDRVDPAGGYCFAGVWHGWPVSDCTAEAILARTSSPFSHPMASDVAAGVRFILQTQNADGGFGSYEPRRTPFSIEWLNPAEMFGDSMTESSYVECTASCVAALARARPSLARPELVDGAIEKAVTHLRLKQYPNGSWPGTWGVRLIYGTMFGIRGLLAGGVPSGDPQIRKACAWLKSHQREDGSWGEAHVAAQSDQYRDDDEGQVTQTAWALLALLEASDSAWGAIERAAHFLVATQLSSGQWPQQKPAGVFFHTALLDYTLYQSYFPVWALAQYETHRKRRAGLHDAPAPTRDIPAASVAAGELR